MKNVLLMAEAYGGGVKTYIDTIMLNRQQIAGVHIKAFISSKRLDKNEEISSEYLIDDNLSFGISPLRLIKAFKKLNQIVKSNKIDIIHANSTFSGIVIYLYAFYNRRLFYIYTPHGYYSFKNMGKVKKYSVKFVEKKINASANLIIHVSYSEEIAAIENNLVSPEKSLVILNGTKNPEIKSVKKRGRNFTIVNLARVDDPKNPFEFIKIARDLIKAIPSLQFIWAGNGRYLEEARARIRGYQLEDKIEFIGFVKQKEKILEQSDLYFSTSQYEGLPFAVVEAMSYKLPLLLSDITGHRDLVEGENNGLLFKSDEHQRVFHFIQSLVDDKEKWASLSNGSYRIFNERFTINQMLKRLGDVYRSV
ncbi:glycosyltransferase [Planococcus sp. 1R117A]|uniref:glycosyltransferase n=1 Tax=Planococcus sp. 1R117A TaxID=3447020 RepID=UPI003EDC4377